MCTVTYLPFAGHGFLLTSNRDELVERSAIPPQRYLIGEQEILFPKDPQGQGSWFASAMEGNWTACLLNGAAEKHHHNPPYRKSRGLVLLDFFSWNDPERFAKEEDFSGIEPFTMVMVHADGKNRLLFQLRWDEKQVSFEQFDPSKPRIWSSSTLYTPEVRALRETWFAKWLQQFPEYTQRDVIRFHHFAGDGDAQHNLVMMRNEQLRTISITSVATSGDGPLLFVYHDLLKQQEYAIEI